MITKMTGVLTRVLDDEARLAGRRRSSIRCWCPKRCAGIIQMRIGQEMTFHVTEYLEGNSGGNRFVPRRIGFNTEAELEFFDLFCTVEKIGAKKALKAMARPVKEIADAISRQDARWLSHAPRHRRHDRRADRHHAEAEGDEVRDDERADVRDSCHQPVSRAGATARRAGSEAGSRAQEPP